MNELTAFAFSFKTFNEKRKSNFIIPKLGNVNEQGITLNNELIVYHDILRINYYKGYLVITFVNYPIIGKSISEWLIKKNNCIIIKSDMIKEIKLAFDIFQTRNAKNKRVCGFCDNPIDWDNHFETQYQYCEECHSISDKHGLLISNGEQFDICPETGYYDRLRKRKQYQYYYWKGKMYWTTTSTYGGDNLGIEFFHKNIFKNMMFLVGLPGTIKEWYKANEGHHPDFTELAEANFSSRCGEVKEAADTYTKMQMRLPYFPALHYNLALTYLQANNLNLAKRYFQKSLEGCANYTPTIKILKYLSEKEKLMDVSPTPASGSQAMYNSEDEMTQTEEYQNDINEGNPTMGQNQFSNFDSDFLDNEEKENHP
ncbi:tetratricopeptide repeat protein [Flammeovirga yaeyamensis]|uniref:Tetratricopeptide repeat protein n=1 Tax=Flammeovirga yaeyamensis TaxID=367791 RepID=A0AAX1MXW5_9BACT|nr:tetratricopeptide repeat protein [Flammeovirga yaeyamensis]MBB3696444.1 tetratricopeptide (TPR) repeat protein [Flammeovirga yaeyamensis]NMF35123.1 tetratricopeptide repeat protein [Flammeovirga yaeyamensis]QWG00057.1 tetratricopeptide repeat protein [Flammeovirga yaeyamensis]